MGPAAALGSWARVGATSSDSSGKESESGEPGRASSTSGKSFGSGVFRRLEDGDGVGLQRDLLVLIDSGVSDAGDRSGDGEVYLLSL